MVLRFSACLVLTALLGLTSPVCAEPLGVYLGAAAGMAQADVDSEGIRRSLQESGFSVDGFSSDETDLGWRLFAGYGFHPNLAVELSWVDLGESEGHASVGGPNPGMVSTHTAVDGVNLGLKAVYPFAEKFSLFAKLGLLAWNADAEAVAVLAGGDGVSASEGSGTDISFGLGVSYSMSGQLQIRADWDRYALGGDFHPSSIPIVI